MARGGAAGRRVSEIAVLRRTGGQVRAVTAWHVDRGFTDAATELRRLLASRSAR
ncbi:hypothetical protein [Mycobacterium kyorinense]|uniref:hypothetical protein n=1 Tax=Mycobacterium kyorinense TaxID=487514 RepID=UPI0012E6FD14|nr:hypothetical protein [Mycobacterium kyorinense]